MRRVAEHPVLGKLEDEREITIYVDGMPYPAREGEMLAAALTANGISTFRYTKKHHRPRGIFCAIGRCTDCVMTVDGVPNVRTCVTPARDGMRLSVQQGTGTWRKEPQV